MINNKEPLVTSIKEKCRVCYACVRECPAKAIRIALGQAEVLPERCIGCGNCVRVCSQNAKRVYSGIPETEVLIQSDQKVAAIVAPSFPAEYNDINYKIFNGMLKKLGFDYIVEVGFGADLVAEAYAKLLKEHPDKAYISSPCPAIVAFIEKYYPSLIENLAPIVSPMIATARAFRQIHDDNIKMVFIGPCIGKKEEARAKEMKHDIDSVLTFVELNELFKKNNITRENSLETEFDEPQASIGRVFALSSGLLATAKLKEDIIDRNFIVSDGRTRALEIIKEFSNGMVNTKLMDILCCDGGCIMGAGFSEKKPMYYKHERVSAFIKAKNRQNNKYSTCKLEDFKNLDLNRTYSCNDQRIPLPENDAIEKILNQLGKFEASDELNCGACGYETCRDHALAIFKGLAESNMCLPHTIEQLKLTVTDLEESHEKLADTQQALIQSEKLASMGQLSAGIAHELNNPLGVVLMYSNLLLEQAKKSPEFTEDLKMICQQAERCKKIVSGLLNFARQNKIVTQNINIYNIINETLKTITKKPNIDLKVINEMADPHVQIDKDQIIQVLINLVDNARDAIKDEKGEITVTIIDKSNDFIIQISDNGPGIRQDLLSKIFHPFITTKQMGVGTGLGLAVVYGIIKMHQGNIMVESNTDLNKGPTGTSFIIRLPKKSIKNRERLLSDERNEDDLIG